MATFEEIEIGDNGKVTVTAVMDLRVPVTAVTVPEAVAGIERISQMIADPDSAIAEITRLIALEIAGVMKKMTDDDPLRRGTSSMRDLNDQIKSYRELQRTLTESESLSKRDVLNLDGPKFKFIFTELIKLFKKSLKDSGVDDNLTQNIMLQFGDLVKASDESLRRDLSKIEGGR